MAHGHKRKEMYSNVKDVDAGKVAICTRDNHKLLARLQMKSFFNS